ncbi:MAG: RDD family protein, partial [Armatimonadota bacterium]
MSFDDTRTVVTPEQVSVTYRLAGIGTRFAAMLLDTSIQFIVVLVVILLAGALGSQIEFLDIDFLGAMTSSWLIALMAIAIFGIIWGYFILWETVWHGQTPGKRAAGIRVMRDGGYPIDFRAAFVRNIARYVDFLPGFYGIGALAVFLSKDSKRLGDYAAGTVVVVDSRPAPAYQTPAPAPRQYRLLGDPALLDLRAMSRDEFTVVDRFLSRRVELPEN